MCRKLLNKNFKHLVNIIDVEVIHNNIKSLFLIKMEECSPLPKTMRTLFINMGIAYRVKEYVAGNENMNGIKSKAHRRLLDSYDNPKYYSNYEDEISKFIELDMKFIEEINLFKQIEEIKEELIKSGLIKYKLDISNLNNFMLSKGEICLVDIIYPIVN